MDGIESLQAMGPGRYRVLLVAPWGQAFPAEMVLGLARGWPEREESQDPRWSAFPVGPAVVGFRLLGTVAPVPGVRIRSRGGSFGRR